VRRWPTGFETSTLVDRYIDHDGTMLHAFHVILSDEFWRCRASDKDRAND
jgi:hypothetical protein